MRLTRLLGSLCLASTFVACGGDSSTGPGSTTLVPGRYVLHTLNGFALPLSIPQSDGSTFTIVADTLNVTSTSSYNEHVASRTTANGVTTPALDVFTGTYTQSSGTITLTDDSDGTVREGTLANGVLTLTDNADQVTFVFHQQ